MKRDRYAKKNRLIDPKQRYRSLLLIQDKIIKGSNLCHTTYGYRALVYFVTILLLGLLLHGRERSDQAEQEEDGNSVRLTLDIHLLLYERLDSASLLLQAISQPKYPNSTDLYIHIDRSKSEEKHEQIEALAHDFNWKSGTKFIISPTSRLGLKKTWLSINPDCNKVDAIAVFEDDILPSGGWFLWTSFILSKHAKSTQLKDSILGVSLSSLKLNELKFPFETWSPGIIHDYYHLHQTPSSWGSIFLCRRWQEFREYATARMDPMFESEEIGGVSLEGGRPGDPNFHIQELHSNWWSASWKKYMVEFVYAKGMLTVYPNLKRQNVGLVLSLARNGEHMKDGKHGRNTVFEETELASFPDILEAIHFSKVATLDGAMLFDVHFQPTTLKRMKQNGVEYIDSLQRKGPPYSSVATMFSPQHTNIAMKKDREHRYLGYMPQQGQGNQLLSLAKAISLSITLKRILLVPHIFIPSKSTFDECSDDEFCVEFSDVFSMSYISRKRRKDLSFIILTAGNFRLFRPDRIYTTDSCMAGRGSRAKMYWTYFNEPPTVQVKDCKVTSMKNVIDAVLFFDDMSYVQMPESLVQSLGRELYYPNTRLRRVTVDLMEYLGLEIGHFSCLHLPIKHLRSSCNDEDRFRANSRYIAFWNQGYSCMPSRHHVSSLVGRHNAFYKHIFFPTDDLDQLHDFIGQAWDNEAIKSSHDTREYLGLRFPKADQKFIEALHVSIDQYLCILSTRSILSRFSMFSYQVELNRYGKLTDFWLQEGDVLA